MIPNTQFSHEEIDYGCKPTDQAFPSSDAQYRYPGMTMRQYFAGLAMQGILAGHHQVEYGDIGLKRDPLAEEIAKLSKLIADALIAELSKP